MIQRFFFGVLLLSLSGSAVLPIYSAEPPTPAVSEEKPALAESQAKAANSYQVTPGPLDGQIAFWTAKLLEKLHYLQQPFDEATSIKFFDRYFEALDPQHLIFTQGDLAKFDHYRTNLNNLTTRQQKADTRPSCEIFELFVTRWQQRVAYVDELLKTENFTFDADERIAVNRHELPYPKDLQEANALWRERLRFEYLQERLGKIDARKKSQNPKNKTGETGTAAQSNTKPKPEKEEIVATLSHRYHRILRTFTDWNNDDVLQVYLTTLAHVYDPHSDYFGHAQLESFAIGMNLRLFGIGAELISEDGYCTIRRLLPGGPALESKKIKEKDRIVAVAQGEQPFVDVVDMNLNKAVQLIRGPIGTQVRLKMIPPDTDAAAPAIISLTRREIKLEDSAAKAKIIEVPSSPNGQNLRLGVIDLPSFYAEFDVGGTRRMELANAGGATSPKSTTADVSLLLKKLNQEKVAGVILDLRRNGGGSLEEAIKLTGLFIGEGPVVQVKNFDGKVEIDRDTDPSIEYAGPLIVLTSKLSASASEILAGALQDYGRALIVGDASTHGKGTVQSVNPLGNYLRGLPPGFATNDPGALKLTIKKFYRASGASTQKMGVVPDIILPSIFNESKEIGESALDNPLSWDTTDPAKFDRLNLVGPYLTDLRKHSAERVATEREFDYVREDIQHYKKSQADKTVSLNEKQRLQEKEEFDARQKARDKERRARKDPQEKVYELTLKQCELPGLPPPVAKTNAALVRLSSATAAAGSSTNLAAASGAAAPEINLSEDSEDEKPAAVDATLVEAEHILEDYVAVLPKGDILAAEHKPDSVLDLNRKD